MIKKICKHCGKRFEVHPCRKETAQYCSKSCHSSYKNKGDRSQWWKGGPKIKTCPRCGKEFLAHPGDKRRKYCSRECHDTARMKRIELTCDNCGKKFVQKLSRARRYNNAFCSHECYSIYKQGENHPLWNGGSSFEPYPPTFNEPFKRMIRERDNYICAICGKHGKSVHHIDYVKASTNPENCVTLCRSCHSKTNSNRKYWRELFTRILP